VIYLAEFIFVLAGLSKLASRNSTWKLEIGNWKLRLLPLVIIFLGIVPAALTRENGHVLRSILTLPGWQLIAAIGIVELQNTNRKFVRLCILALVVQVVVFMTAYFGWYPTTFASDWQYGLKETSQYLAEHESAYDQVVVSKWFGESQLFFAFYNLWDPIWYITANKDNIAYEKQGKLWLDQLDEYHLGKYTFKYIDYSQRDKSGRTLYIGKFDDFGENPRTLKTIYYPDGTVAMYIMDGKDQ
jgi:hypothetical protein